MLKSQNGITLVALVVTIVILIILATVSITVLIDGGLIGTTENAVSYYQEQQNDFYQLEQNLVSYIDSYLPASR